MPRSMPHRIPISLLLSLERCLVAAVMEYIPSLTAYLVYACLVHSKDMDSYLDNSAESKSFINIVSATTDAFTTKLYLDYIELLFPF